MMTLCFANWKLNFSLYLTLWKYFVLAGWIMELIKVEKHVEKQFFVGFGFSISGDAWVMGNYNSDRRLLSLTGMDGFSWHGRFSSDVLVSNTHQI